MGIRVLVIGLCLSLNLLQAQRLSWKPSDFRSLTSLPWEDEGKSMAEVIQTIFLEPNQEVRYPVLAEYMRQIPLEAMEAAFRLCILYEGTQNPNHLVEFFLTVWAERDPVQAVAKAKTLLELVVIEGDPLSLDSWGNPPIRVANAEALRKSSFWLHVHAVNIVASVVASSDLPRIQKNQLLKEFGDAFLAVAEWYPWQVERENGARPSRARFKTTYVTYHGDLIEVFRNPETRAEVSAQNPAYDQVTREAALLRCLNLQPKNALKLLEIARSISGARVLTHGSAATVGSFWFLWMWSSLDPLAMQHWAASVDGEKDPYRRVARAVLMKQVPVAVRDHWLGQAADHKQMCELYGAWAECSPETALPAAALTGDAEILSEVHFRAVYPQMGFNYSHWALGVLRDFDIGRWWRDQRKANRGELPNGWCIVDMEEWLDADVGEAARYGYEFITTTPFVEQAPRELLIEIFEGRSLDSADDGALDRTFCGLRFWAMWKPEEMQKWIATLQDERMRKALAWTLDNPWGREEREEGR